MRFFKKLLKWFLYLLGTLFVLLGLGYLLLRSSGVQTYLTNKISAYFLEETGAELIIQGVDFEFFDRLVLENLLLKDHKKDTLLSVNELAVGITSLKMKENSLSLGDIVLRKPCVRLVKYKEDTLFNYTILLRHFNNSNNDDISGKPFRMDVGALKLEDLSFVYQIQDKPKNADVLDYNDIHVSEGMVDIKNFCLLGDSTSFDLLHLSAKEKSGLHVLSMQSKTSISSGLVSLDAFNLQLEHSHLKGQIGFSYDTPEDFLDFMHKVSIDAVFHPSKLHMKELAYFASSLVGNSTELEFSGNIKGTVNDLRAKHFEFLLNEGIRFKGDFALTGLPDIESTFMIIDANECSANKHSLESLQLPPFDKGDHLSLPDNIAYLGIMKFYGNFTGYINDFVAYGSLSTALGNIKADLSMARKIVGEDTTYNYKGKVGTSGFDLGKLSGEGKLSKVAFQLNVDGKGLTPEKLKANIRGEVSSIVYSGYNYKNILVEGDVARQIFNGKLAMKDENIDLHYEGEVDYRSALPVYNFKATLGKTNLFALRLLDDTLSRFSGRLIINGSGNKLSNLSGKLLLSDINYSNKHGSRFVEAISVEMEDISSGKLLNVNSSFMQAKLEGEFELDALGSAFMGIANSYLPNLHFDGDKKTKQNFAFNIDIDSRDSLEMLFLPKLKLTGVGHLYGSMNTVVDDFSLEGTFKSVSFLGKELNDISITGKDVGKELHIKATCLELKLSDSLVIHDPLVDMITSGSQNSIDTKLSWFQSSAKKNNSQIFTRALIGEDQKLKLLIKPSEIYISDSLWRVGGQNSYVLIDSNLTNFNNVTLSSMGQTLNLIGSLSENPDDELRAELVTINLETLNPFLKSSDITLKGIVSGGISIKDFYNTLKLESTINSADVYFNEEPLGDGIIKSNWQRENEGVTIEGEFTRGIVKNMLFKGVYYPLRKQNSLDIDVDFQAMRLQLFERYVHDYCSSFVGQFSGGIKVTGTLKKPLLDGKLNVKAKKISIDYLNVAFGFSGEVDINDNSFGVRDLIINDNKPLANQKKYGTGTATVNGKVYHENFKNFQLDFDILTDNFQCLNTNERLNELYYGNATVSGVVNFFGFTSNDILIDANLKTERGTQLNIPLTATGELGETKFVTFVKSAEDSISVSKKRKVDLSGIKMNFELEVTPVAEVQMIFDSKVGDIIRSRGNGNISMGISTLGDFSMYGDYVITEGDYLFTLKNIINKRFELEKGGIISWTGSPYEATANIAAVYKQRASIHPFFPNDSSSTYRKRYPVNCKLLMTDKLMSPQINFNIELPTLDESTRQQIYSYINTEQERNRQVFSLLILKSFVTPPQLIGLGSPEANAADAGVATSTELLSNQLSNWLSQISNDFDIGVNYRPGDDLSDDELEVALSTQLLNDRVTIDGNLGVSDGTTSQQNTNNIAGDVNVEYKVTDDGKLRVRAFNRSNDNTVVSNTSAPYTQGVGVFYKEEFNTFGELYRRVFKRERKKKNPD